MSIHNICFHGEYVFLYSATKRTLLPMQTQIRLDTYEFLSAFSLCTHPTQSAEFAQIHTIQHRHMCMCLVMLF